MKAATMVLIRASCLSGKSGPIKPSALNRIRHWWSVCGSGEKTKGWKITSLNLIRFRQHQEILEKQRRFVWYRLLLLVAERVKLDVVEYGGMSE